MSYQIEAKVMKQKKKCSYICIPSFPTKVSSTRVHLGQCYKRFRECMKNNEVNKDEKMIELYIMGENE